MGILDNGKIYDGDQDTLSYYECAFLIMATSTMAIKTPYRFATNALDIGEIKPALGDITTNNDDKNKLKKFYYLFQKSSLIKT